MRTVILGSSGMLGSMVTKVFGYDAVPISRPEFDATKHDPIFLEPIINCIGLIKPYCDDVEQAIKVNALFPHRLSAGTIQIATDCVYSGDKGHYLESDPHDATDVYGKTKSLGEASHLRNLRCSIIGPEVKNHLSLLDWFLAQDKPVKGFTNHLWNGITTLHFARIVRGALREGIELPQLQHIVPADEVTKMGLLLTIKEVYKKNIDIEPAQAPQRVDRTLATENPKLNRKLWQAAGYKQPPTIRQMLEELAAL